MENYNYADEIVKDNDHQRNTRTRNNIPREEILNDQDQQVPVNLEDKELIKPAEKVQDQQDGKEDDTASTNKSPLEDR